MHFLLETEQLYNLSFSTATWTGNNDYDVDAEGVAQNQSFPPILANLPCGDRRSG